MNDIQPIDEIYKKYIDEWVLVKVIEEDEFNRPTMVEFISHSRSREDIYHLLKDIRDDVYLFFTGDIPKKGYAFAF